MPVVVSRVARNTKNYNNLWLPVVVSRVAQNTKNFNNLWLPVVVRRVARNTKNYNNLWLPVVVSRVARNTKNYNNLWLAYPFTGSMTVAPSYSSPASIFCAGNIKSCIFAWNNKNKSEIKYLQRSIWTWQSNYKNREILFITKTTCIMTRTTHCCNHYLGLSTGPHKTYQQGLTKYINRASQNISTGPHKTYQQGLTKHTNRASQNISTGPHKTYEQGLTKHIYRASQNIWTGPHKTYEQGLTKKLEN